MQASEFMLDDATYANVKDGWNLKLNASSQKLSDLTPFIELYAVFATNDTIFKNPMMFSQVADRAIDIQFQFTKGSHRDTAFEFEDRFQIPMNAKIVPLASSAKSQIEPDLIWDTSYRGQAGINDLAVTRGASGPMNIKYSMNMTMPNPEVINEMYEYSKLMILNSKFLLIYGWNPSGFMDSKLDNGSIVPPPRLVNVSSTQGAQANIVELNGSNGGFYKSSLVTLNRFNFSLDNVGHLGGKLDFLTLAGNFLAATRSNIVSTNMKKLLNGYSGSLFQAGAVDSGSVAEEGDQALRTLERQLEIVDKALEESHAYANAWLADMTRRSLAWQASENATPETRYGLDVGPPFYSGEKFRATRNTGNWIQREMSTEEEVARAKFGLSRNASPEEIFAAVERLRALPLSERVASSERARGNVTQANLGKAGHDAYLDNHMIRPYGSLGLEYRANPITSGEAERYAKFTGTMPTGEQAPLIEGVDIPLNFRDPEKSQLITIDDWLDQTKYFELPGIGYSESNRWDEDEHFGSAKIPKRIRDPQDFDPQDLLTNPIYKSDVEVAMDLWQSAPDFEGYAGDLGYFPRDVEQFEAGANGQRVSAGIKREYVPGETATNENKSRYENDFAGFFGDLVSEKYRTQGPMGVMPGQPIQYSDQKLYRLVFLNWWKHELTKEKSDYGFMDVGAENGIPWTNPSRVPAGEFDDYLFEQRTDFRQAKDENGEDLWEEFLDENGNPATNDKGEILRKPVMELDPTNDNPTYLDTMPAYGRELMNDIWNNFMELDNPNRSRFFPVNPRFPNSSVNRNQLGKRFREPSESERDITYTEIEFTDPETLKIMQSSCVISTMLLDIAPKEEETSTDSDAALWREQLDWMDTLAASVGYETEDYQEARDEAEAQEFAESVFAEPPVTDGVPDSLTKLAVFETEVPAPLAAEFVQDNSTGAGDSELGPPPIKLNLIAHAQPVYYFLGSVLEALRIAVGNKVKFMYDDIPMEGVFDTNSGFPVPIPKVNIEKANAVRAQVDELGKEMVAWYDKYVEISNKHPDASSSYNRNNNVGNVRWPNYSGDKTGKRNEEMKAAGYRYPTEEEFGEEGAEGEGIWQGVDFNNISIPGTGRGRRFLNHEHTEDDDKRAWGNAISDEEFNRQYGLKQSEHQRQVAIADGIADAPNEIIAPLMCKNVFELPIEINVARKILTEATAPLHSLINQILKACNSTCKTIKLATRPWAADETYLEIFVANIRVDGMAQEVFENFDVHGFLQDSTVRRNIRDLVSAEHFNIAVSDPMDATPAQLAAARNATLGAYFSTKAIVCEFGSERSLVESFNLSSKVDPLAFATFRLPDVIGGQQIDISAVVRGNLANESMGLMNDIRSILEDGMYNGYEELKSLNIVGSKSISGKTIVNTETLRSFLLANCPEAVKIQTTFLTTLMAADQEFNTKVIALQNEAITGSGDPNNPQNNSFYGGVLSTYLRSISLTIHGVVGLSMFNVIYVKGLMRGIEGLYLITSVNESLTPASFSTSLECKLIQYKDSSITNPLAANRNVTLEAVAAETDGSQVTDFDALFIETEENLGKTTVGSGILDYRDQ